MTEHLLAEILRLICVYFVVKIFLLAAIGFCFGGRYFGISIIDSDEFDEYLNRNFAILLIPGVPIVWPFIKFVSSMKQHRVSEFDRIEEAYSNYTRESIK